MNAKILDITGTEAIITLDDTTIISLPTYTLQNTHQVGDSINLDIANLSSSINNGHCAPLCQKLMDFF